MVRDSGPRRLLLLEAAKHGRPRARRLPTRGFSSNAIVVTEASRESGLRAQRPRTAGAAIRIRDRRPHCEHGAEVKQRAGGHGFCFHRTGDSSQHPCKSRDRRPSAQARRLWIARDVRDQSSSLLASILGERHGVSGQRVDEEPESNLRVRFLVKTFDSTCPV